MHSHPQGRFLVMLLIPCRLHHSAVRDAMHILFERDFGRECFSAFLQDHFSAVTSLSLTPDGWTLLSAGRDKVANLWDMKSYKKVVTVPVFEAVEGELQMFSENP